MSKKAIKADADTRPIEYYNYIVEGQKIWRKTDQKLAEDEKGAPKKDDAMPYELKEVKGRDDKKRIVHFVEGTDVKYKHTIPFCNELTIDIPDMANVGAINEMDLLNNLVNRLNRDETFSNCGSTLIIFNPYKRIQGVYGEDMIKYYREQQDLNPPESRDENPKPHLYDLVLIAIREVKRSGSRSQALLVSGESGAGKTVATKNAMECVTKYFAKPGAKDDIPLEQKILNTNPILEAFGNAKTVRNENSSRFGKYVKLKLNPEATEIVGAEMTGYLLEKSRITDGNENERNYHVFYHLLACGDSNLLSQLHLDPDPKKYKFLNYGPNQVYTAKDIDDHEFFIEMDRCFNDNGFSPEEKLQVYKVVAAVLHFGNVTIKRKSDTEASFEPIEEYRYACELLGYDEDTLKEPLTRKYIAIEKKYGNVFTEEELKTFKNAVAKEMFNKTFFWIIEKLNLMLKEKTPAGRYIGLLDIFGFECFVHNSIEQLCINYTNECLQQLYIKDIFENDIEEFKKEGLGDKVNLLAATYKDNKDLLIMIKGFFEELNDVKKNDTIYENIKKFPTRVGKPGVYKDAKTCSFEVPPFKDNKFMVVHTAKKVTYETDNFIEKNADEIKVNVLLKIYESKSTIFKMMYANVIDEKLLDAKIAEDTDTETVSADRKRKRFLGTKFSMDMDKLTEELLACDHHYVRCIKPNELKSPGIFYYNFIFNQIEYLGILSSIQVRQNGFPIRRRYQDFFDAFKIILSISKKDIVDKQEWYKSKTDEIINKLVEGRGLGDISEKRLYGNTKVYMKQEFSVKLEQIKQEMLITKTNAGKKLRTAVLYLKMKKKIPKIEGSIKKLQDFFNGNKAKIRLQKKKDKIKIIQALYFTVYQQKYFTEVQNNYETVINIFEMIKARNTLSKSKNLMKFLSWRMQIYLANLKDNLRKKIKKVTIDICINEIVKKRIERHERGILWENTRKFFEMALVRTKYPKIVQTSKKTVSEYKYINIMQVFTAHMLLWKVQSRRKATKEIYIAATTQNLMRNIWCVIESTKIIQKYIGRLLNKKDALKQIDDFYFKKNKIGKGETKKEKKKEKKLKKKAIGPDGEEIEGEEFEEEGEEEEEENAEDEEEDKMIEEQNQELFKTLFPNRRYFGKDSPLNDYHNIRELKTSEMISSIKPGGGLNTAMMSTPGSRSMTKGGYSYGYGGSGYENFLKSKYMGEEEKEKEIKFKIPPISETVGNNASAYDQKYSKFLNMNTSTLKGRNGQIIPTAKEGSKEYPKIYTFAHIIDMDIVNQSFSSEIYDKNWADEFAKIERVNMRARTPIQLIFTSDTHTIILNCKGHAFSFGWNNNGQCGVSPSETQILNIVPETLKNYDTIRGGLHNKDLVLPITNYAQAGRPINNKFFGRVEKFALGEDYTLILNNKEKVYAMGENSNGQLGLGHSKNVYLPQRHIAQQIKEGHLGVSRIKTIGVTKNANVVLTYRNDIYIWYTTANLPAFKPRRLYLDKKIKVSQISCGKNFIIYLGMNGVVYGSGSNCCGELCLPRRDIEHITPEELTNVNKLHERIIEVRCGFKHTSCITESGKCLTWGNNTYGQIGSPNLSYPDVYEIPAEFGFIIQTCAGFRSTVIMNDEHEIFYFGVLGANVRNKKGLRCQLDLKLKNIEVADPNEFFPLRLMTSWNRGFSLFYITFADLREINHNWKNLKRTKEMVKLLSINWVDEKLRAPYIKEIAPFFNENYMYTTSEEPTV